MSGQLALPYMEAGTPLVSANLDLFSKPYLQTGVERIYYQEILPNSPLSNSSNTISFEYSGDQAYLDLDDSFMMVQLKVTKEDGTNLDAYSNTHSVGTMNAPLYSLFKDLDIKVNDVSISNNLGTYTWSAMVNILMNYGQDFLETKASLAGFYRDKDPATTNTMTGATGFKQRAQLTQLSRPIRLIGPIMGHFFHSISRYFINMCKISWTFSKNTPAFFLKSGDTGTPGYKYEILEMKLYLKKVQLYPSTLMYLENRLASENFQYPTTVYYTKELTLPANSRSEIYPNVFNNPFRPKRCLVFFLEQTNFLGSYGTSPFKFSNFSVENVSFHFDNQVFPSQPFNLDFSNANEQDFAKGYLSLFKNGIFKGDNGPIAIQLDNYADSFFFLAFSFGEEASYGEFFNEKKIGNCDMSIKLGANTNSTLKIMLYVEYDEIIAINQGRQILRDFHL